ncbi:MAG TPA: hypothetical protein VIZ43_16975 [Trebonia sp.]
MSDPSGVPGLPDVAGEVGACGARGVAADRAGVFGNGVIGVAGVAADWAGFTRGSANGAPGPPGVAADGAGWTTGWAGVAADGDGGTRAPANGVTGSAGVAADGAAGAAGTDPVGADELPGPPGTVASVPTSGVPPVAANDAPTLGTESRLIASAFASVVWMELRFSPACTTPPRMPLMPWCTALVVCSVCRRNSWPGASVLAAAQVAWVRSFTRLRKSPS